jgi:hypothetical protein
MGYKKKIGGEKDEQMRGIKVRDAGILAKVEEEVP